MKKMEMGKAAQWIGGKIKEMAKSKRADRDSEGSDEDRNPRHRKREWRKVGVEENEGPQMGDNLKGKGDWEGDGLGHFQPHIHGTVGEQQRPLTPPLKVGVGSPNRSYSWKEVQALLDAANNKGKEDLESPWVKHKSKATMKRERALANELEFHANKLRAGEAGLQGRQCWHCGSPSHLKGECPKGRLCFRCMQRGHIALKCTNIEGSDGEDTRRRQPPSQRGGRRPSPLYTGRKVVERRRDDRDHHDQRIQGVAVVKRPQPALKVFLQRAADVQEAHEVLKTKLGIVRQVYGHPSNAEIVEGLGSICEKFRNRKWEFTRIGGGWLVEFPSTEALKFMLSKPIHLCKEGQAGYKVTRWNGDEGSEKKKMSVIAAIVLHHLPCQFWDKGSLASIVGGFGMLLEVMDDTVSWQRLDAARLMVRCESEAVIPHQLEVFYEGRLFKVDIKISSIQKEDVQLIFDKTKREEAGPSLPVARSLKFDDSRRAPESSEKKEFSFEKMARKNILAVDDMTSQYEEMNAWSAEGLGRSETERDGEQFQVAISLREGQISAAPKRKDSKEVDGHRPTSALTLLDAGPIQILSRPDNRMGESYVANTQKAQMVVDPSMINANVPSSKHVPDDLVGNNQKNQMVVEPNLINGYVPSHGPAVLGHKAIAALSSTKPIVMDNIMKEAASPNIEAAMAMFLQPAVQNAVAKAIGQLVQSEMEAWVGRKDKEDNRRRVRGQGRARLGRKRGLLKAPTNPLHIAEEEEVEDDNLVSEDVEQGITTLSTVSVEGNEAREKHIAEGITPTPRRLSTRLNSIRGGGRIC